MVWRDPKNGSSFRIRRSIDCRCSNFTVLLQYVDPNSLHHRHDLDSDAGKCCLGLPGQSPLPNPYPDSTKRKRASDSTARVLGITYVLAVC